MLKIIKILCDYQDFNIPFKIHLSLFNFIVFICAHLFV